MIAYAKSYIPTGGRAVTRTNLLAKSRNVIYPISDTRGRRVEFELGNLWCRQPQCDTANYKRLPYYGESP